MTNNATLSNDLATFFESIPDHYLLLTSDLHIITASKAYREATFVKLEDIQGKNIFDALPYNPALPEADGITNLKNSLEWVIAHKAPHKMSLQRFDVQHPDLPTVFNERYWLATNTPVLNEEHEILYIIHSVSNVHDTLSSQQQPEQSQSNLKTLNGQQITNSEFETARTEVELERKKLYNILMQAPAMICIFEGPEHVFKLVNPSYQTLVGDRQILGKPIAEAMPELSDQSIFKLLDQVYKTGESLYAHEMKVQLDHKNSGGLGDNFYNFTYQALRNLEGEIYGILVFAYEVTSQVNARLEVELREQKLQKLNEQLEEANKKILATNSQLSTMQQTLQELNQELEVRVKLRTQELELSKVATEIQSRRLHSIFMEAPTPFVLLEGPNLTFKLVNPVYQQIFPGRKLVGKTLMEALPELEGTPVPDLLNNVYRTGETYVAKELPLMLARHEGEPPEEIIWTFTYQARRNERGEVDGVLAFAQEVTDHVHARREIENREKEARMLTKELAEINEELKTTNEQLKRTNVDLDNFIYTASHDLKTPISNIEGLMHILFDAIPDSVLEADELEDVTAMIDDSIARFKRTINHLTEVTKLQKENNQVSSLVNLIEVIEAVSLDLSVQIEESDVKLDINVADCPSIQFSEKNLRSIVYNLLSNAIKYRAPDRTPKIKIRCRTEGNYSVFSMQDNGLGMDLNGSQKLFNMFSRLHDHVEGSGIGLYMVKKIVDNAVGRIEVESEVGIGSTFTVYLKNKPA